MGVSFEGMGGIQQAILDIIPLQFAWVTISGGICPSIKNTERPVQIEGHIVCLQKNTIFVVYDLFLFLSRILLR